MRQGDFHFTQTFEPTITFMKKTVEGKTHAKSLLHTDSPFEFDFDFDRYQLSEKELYYFFLDALKP